MKVNPNVGKHVNRPMLVNIPRLVTAYYTETPDPAVSAERVTFGTSGHHGSAFDTAFNEQHILAINQAICLYCNQQIRMNPSLPYAMKRLQSPKIFARFMQKALVKRPICAQSLRKHK